MDNQYINIYLSNIEETEYYYGVPYSTSRGGSTWRLQTSLTPLPILTLPIGWEGVKIDWKRDPHYLGVFRSQSQEFKFVADARAILLQLFYISGGGIQAQCKMRIDQFQNVQSGYLTAYKSEIDFSSIIDGKYNQGEHKAPQYEGELSASTLDSELFQYLESLGDTQFNIPIWNNIAPPTDTPIWVTEASFILHDGIKLLYNSTFTSSASDDNPLVFGSLGSGAVQIGCFNGGRHGSSPNSGFHTIINLSQYNIVQNNGSTTFVGNDILNPFLLQKSQSNSANGSAPGEENFNGTNNSQPYTRDNYSMKNLLPQSIGNLGGSINMDLQINATINPVIFPDQAIQFTSTGGYGFGTAYLGFAIFEIDKDDMPEHIGGQFIPHVVHKLVLDNVTSYPEINQTIPITLNYDKVYIFTLITDGLTTDIDGLFGITFASFSNLQISFKSTYDYGQSGVPVPAPQLNPSVFPAFRGYQLLDRIVKCFPTTETDLYGFPIQVATSLSGTSSYLSDSASTPQGDAIGYQAMITSSYCIHDLQGQSYIPISFNQLFNFYKKVFGCGASISADGNSLQIEKLSHYFQDVSILNLDDYKGVSSLVIKPFNQLGGSNLKLGYTKQDTNSDFGIEATNTELYFNTPLWKLNQTIDLEESDIIVEQYSIEKLRAQKVNQPIGASFDPANPSGSSELAAFYVQPNLAPVFLPAVFDSTEGGSVYNFQPYDPDNNPVSVQPYKLTQRNGYEVGGFTPFSACAQNVDSSALSAPYINGYYYPDSAYNVELSPSRLLERDGGALLHSVLDLFDDENLTFRNSSVMQYNNVALALSGTESNLNVGGASTSIKEFSDKKISDLPPRLFRPFIFSIETVAPVNMWQTMNTNPNGYIQFTWKGVVYKGFIWSISQMISASGHTSFELIAHPLTTNEQLINA